MVVFNVIAEDRGLVVQESEVLRVAKDDCELPCVSDRRSSCAVEAADDIDLTDF